MCANGLLQLIICTVAESPDRQKTHSETGLEPEKTFFFSLHLAVFRSSDSPPPAQTLTCSIIWAGHLAKASHPLSERLLTRSLLRPLLFPHKGSLMPGSRRWHSCCIPPWGSCRDGDEKCLKQRPTLIHRV